MVKFVNGLYQCENCKLSYKNKILAEKCQNWCKKHKSCNLEIIKHSLKTKMPL